MGSKTTYTCDKCGKEVDKKDLGYIEVTLTLPTKAYRTDTHYAKSPDICRDCLKEYGFIMDKSDVQTARVENTTTLRDKIIDLMLDLGVTFDQ